LLSFGAESFVFQVATQKFKDQDIYRTIILPAVLYGCETWSLKLREERKLRVFENMVLRRILFTLTSCVNNSVASVRKLLW